MVLLIDTLNQNRQEEIPRQSQEKKSTLRLTSNLEFQIQIQVSKSKLIFRYCVLEGSQWQGTIPRECYRSLLALNIFFLQTFERRDIFGTKTQQIHRINEDLYKRYLNDPEDHLEELLFEIPLEDYEKERRKCGSHLWFEVKESVSFLAFRNGIRASEIREVKEREFVSRVSSSPSTSGVRTGNRKPNRPESGVA